MGIFGKLLGRKGHDVRSAHHQETDLDDDQEVPPLSDVLNEMRAGSAPLVDQDDDVDKDYDNTDKLLAAAQDSVRAKESSVNIWDLDGDAAALSAARIAPRPEAAAQAAPVIPDLPGAMVSGQPNQLEVAPRIGDGPARKRRTKTRLLGFEKSDGQVVDLFNNPVATSSRGTRYPVGWVVVVKGPGRGESFTLQSGMAQVGRGDDQTIQLDFGDNAISRSNHAAIAYDPETHQVYLGHGGKTNIVRLNDKPVVSTEVLRNGDLIRLGETTLRFVALCDAEFNWAGEDGEEVDNVEIA